VRACLGQLLETGIVIFLVCFCEQAMLISRIGTGGLGTVHGYLQRAEGAGVKWPLPEGQDEQLLEAALFAASQPAPRRRASTQCTPQKRDPRKSGARSCALLSIKKLEPDFFSDIKASWLKPHAMA
jgi:hypothetical protein